MEDVPVGTGGYISGSGLEVVSKVPVQSKEAIFPAQVSGIGGLRRQNALQGGDREMQLLSLSGSFFRRPKEGLNREENHLGLVGPQQVHTLPEIQDDDTSTDMDFSTKRRRHLFIRSQRRLLACPTQPLFLPILSGLGGVSGTMQTGGTESPRNDTEVWISDKLGKIPLNPSNDLCMAGSEVVPFQGNAFIDKGVSDESSPFSEEVQEGLFVHPQGTGGAYGFSVICLDSGSYPENLAERPQ